MSNFLDDIDMMGIIKRPNTVKKTFTWLPKRMDSGKLVIGYYYEMIIIKHGADPRQKVWFQKKYSQKEYFLLKLRGIKDFTLI